MDDRNMVYRNNRFYGDDRSLILIAGIINSALYLIGVFVAGLLTNHPRAWALALITAGLCYLSALVQITFPSWRAIASALVLWSIICGVLAGFAVLLP